MFTNYQALYFRCFTFIFSVVPFNNKLGNVSRVTQEVVEARFELRSETLKPSNYYNTLLLRKQNTSRWKEVFKICSNNSSHY